MRYNGVIGLLVLAILGCTKASVQSTTDSVVGLTELDQKSWMESLAGDAMRGRASGSPEILLAAGFIAGEMDAMGLTPLPGSDSYFQAFSFEENGKTYHEYNVVGYLEGADPALKNEYILIGAHYDHIGVRDAVNGDSIYNGADDDASGTVTMMGIAKLLAAGERPKRSVVFAAWAAEEMGLQGSLAFAANPPIALEDMVVNFNLEMTGHAEELGEGKVFMTGPQYSDLDERVVDVLANGGFELIPDPFAEYNLFYRSDNASFINLNGAEEGDTAAGIPAHSFSTWGTEPHYHKPDDEPDVINYGNMFRLTNAMASAVRGLANANEKVSWTSDDFVRYEGK